MQLHSLVTLIEGKLNNLVRFNGTMVAFGFSVDRLQVLAFLLELGLQKAKLTHCFNVFDKLCRKYAINRHFLTSKSDSWIFKDTIFSVDCRSENPYLQWKVS